MPAEPIMMIAFGQITFQVHGRNNEKSENIEEALELVSVIF